VHISTVRLYGAIHVGCSGQYRTEDKAEIQTMHTLSTDQRSKQRCANKYSCLLQHTAWKRGGLILFTGITFNGRKANLTV